MSGRTQTPLNEGIPPTYRACARRLEITTGVTGGKSDFYAFDGRDGKRDGRGGPRGG